MTAKDTTVKIQQSARSYKTPAAVLHSKEPPLLPRSLNIGRPVAAWLPALGRPTTPVSRWKGNAEKVSENQQGKHNNLTDTNFHRPKPWPWCCGWRRKRDYSQRETRRGKSENKRMIWLNKFILLLSAVFSCC